MGRYRPNGSRTHNRAELLLNGPAYFDRLLHVVNGSQQVLHIQVYIWSGDTTGRRVWDAIVEAARRGVQVFILVDGLSANDLPSAWIDQLREAGGYFRWFGRLFHGWDMHIGRRMHHKMVVADHRYALVSGRNIADRYTDMPGIPGWFDIGLSIEGETAMDLAELCCSVWNGRRHGLARATPPDEAEHKALLKDWPEKAHFELRVRFNDWLRRRSEITATYLHLLRDAKEEVWLVSSYFVPGSRLRRAIADAARRGVRVRVLVAGPSDVFLSKPAERWLYAWLLRQGVHVYEYQRTVLHAKFGVCDQRWATLGSFNLNDLSTYTTLEVNVDVHDEQLVHALLNELHTVLKASTQRVTAANERRASPFARLWNWTAYHVLRLTYNLLTFYYRQQ